jgi:hypothetical protein
VKIAVLTRLPHSCNCCCCCCCVCVLPIPCRQLGASALVAITCIAAAVPINSRLVAASAAKLRVALKHGDTRAKLETELVSGVCACLVWEWLLGVDLDCLKATWPWGAPGSTPAQSQHMLCCVLCYAPPSQTHPKQVLRLSRPAPGRRPSTSASVLHEHWSCPCCAQHSCCRCENVFLWVEGSGTCCCV